MKKTLLCAAAGAAAVAPLAAHAQSAGSNVVTLGWFHIMPQQSSTPMTTNVAPTPINTPLRLPPSFTSPGTGLHTSGADTVGLTVSHFLTDHIAVTSVAGVPPVFRSRGHDQAARPGRRARHAEHRAEAGQPDREERAAVGPAAILQYYFGAANAKFRPFLGLGVSYNWFSDLQLNTNFIKQTQDNLGAVLAAGAGKPGTTSVEAKASSSWQPVFNAGLQYNMTEHFGLIASVTYIPLKTTSTVTIKAADGTVLSESKSDLKADPIISYVGMTYKF